MRYQELILDEHYAILPLTILNYLLPIPNIF
jgi:hypothetical protein